MRPAVVQSAKTFELGRDNDVNAIFFHRVLHSHRGNHPQTAGDLT
jgi:hypothetical protein